MYKYDDNNNNNLIIIIIICSDPKILSRTLSVVLPIIVKKLINILK